MGYSMKNWQSLAAGSIDSLRQAAEAAADAKQLQGEGIVTRMDEVYGGSNWCTWWRFRISFWNFRPPKRKWGITELKRSKNSISRFLKIGLKFCCLDLFGVTIPSWKNLGVWKVMKTFQRHFRGQGNHPTPKVAPVYHFSIHVQPSKGKTASCHHWWHTWINHLRRGGGAVQFGCSVLGSSADQS